jgi:hypothetical protein
MHSDDTAAATTTPPHPDLLIGLDDIASYLRVNRKMVSRFISQGMPAARVGLPLVSTRKLVIEWIEQRAKETARA